MKTKKEVEKDILLFIKNFNPAIFRGRTGLRTIKDILLDYQTELKKVLK